MDRRAATLIHGIYCKTHKLIRKWQLMELEVLFLFLVIIPIHISSTVVLVRIAITCSRFAPTANAPVHTLRQINLTVDNI